MLSEVEDTSGSDLAFKLEFTKARRRRPDNRTEFEPQIIRLNNDEWSTTDTTATAGQEKKQRKLADKAATLLHTIQNLDPGLLQEVQPQTGMPLCKAVQRSKLRGVLIEAGWFPESEILPALNSTEANSKLTKAGHTIENNWLNSLKAKKFINFTRHWVWLP
jgi:hypothetical protein